MKYQIIYADCPWKYWGYSSLEGKKATKCGRMLYPTLSLGEIKSLSVANIADDNCALFLWATMPLLPEALEVIKAWGFSFINCGFVWVKLNPKSGGIYSGIGHWTNGNAELCLFARKGMPVRIAKNVKQIIMAPRGKHSQKPDEVRDRIVQLLGDIPRIELFAREQAEGWDAVGYDLDGLDIRQSLEWIALKE